LAEDFMTAPRFVTEWVMARAMLGVSDPLAYSAVRPPRPDPLQIAPAWKTAFDKLGIPKALLPIFRPDCAALQDALEAPL